MLADPSVPLCNGCKEAVTCHINKGGKMGHIMWRYSTESLSAGEQHSGGPYLMYARREQWPSLALTCLWLMSTGQWFCLQRLHPCSRALSFGALGLETIPTDETWFLQGGTWMLLLHASLHIFSFPLCLQASIITSVNSMTLKMAMPVCLSIYLFGPVWNIWKTPGCITSGRCSWSPEDDWLNLAQ